MMTTNSQLQDQAKAVDLNNLAAFDKPDFRTPRDMAKGWLTSSYLRGPQASRCTFPTQHSRSDAIHKLKKACQKQACWSNVIIRND